MSDKTEDPKVTEDPKDTDFVTNNKELLDAVRKMISVSIENALKKPEEPNNPLDEHRLKMKKEEESKKYNDLLTKKYASISAQFEKIYPKEQANLLLKKLENTPIEDCINFLAQEIIRKSLGESENTRVLLESFKDQDVFDDKSAFSVIYNQAVEKANVVKSRLYGSSTTLNNEVPLETLREISKKLFDGDNREDGLALAADLGLIKRSA